MNDALVVTENDKITKEKSKTKYVSNIIYQGIKRLFDIMCSLIGCLFLLPVVLLVKIAYLLDGDKEKIIFTQNRIGLNGKEFKFYKFRSMVPNADEILFQTLKKDKKLREEYDRNKKLENDPRITRVGQFIRKTSIDELPQLINILKGDMSVIGNRPYLPREKEDMGEYYDEVIKTKPGLTGYWQVSGRSNTTFQDRLRLEKYYSNNCNLKMDIKIFFKTFGVVLLKKGSK